MVTAVVVDANAELTSFPPPEEVLDILIDPAPGAIDIPVPAVSCAGTGSDPVDPIKTCPSVI